MKQIAAAVFFFYFFSQFYPGHLLPLDENSTISSGMTDKPIVTEPPKVENSTTNCTTKNSDIKQKGEILTTPEIPQPIALPSSSQQLQTPNPSNNTSTSVSNSTITPENVSNSTVVTAVGNKTKEQINVTSQSTTEYPGNEKSLNQSTVDSKTEVSTEAQNKTTESSQLAVYSEKSMNETTTIPSRNRRELGDDKSEHVEEYSKMERNTTTLSNMTISTNTTETSTSYHPVYFLGISG